jgi:hypothetical protein
MHHPSLTSAIVTESIADRRRAAAVPAGAARRPRIRRHSAREDVVLRWATPRDAGIVATLAALDSQPVPAPPVLLAEVDGITRAAVGTDGAIVADPFVATGEVVALLRARRVSVPRAGATPRLRRLTRRWV